MICCIFCLLWKIPSIMFFVIYLALAPKVMRISLKILKVCKDFTISSAGRENSCVLFDKFYKSVCFIDSLKQGNFHSLTKLGVLCT